MNLKRHIIILIFALFAKQGVCQHVITDTTQVLEAFTVTSSRLSDFSAGTKTTSFDSASLNQHRHLNLSELLSNESSIFIKSYGAGAIATASFRGTNANHTAVLWNGFNINSPMSGILDLTLIPISFYNNISLQHGGGSALWGSGAVGGTIHLSNDVKYNKGFSTDIFTSAGSFGTLNQNVSLEISKERFVSAIKIYHKVSENDFSFINTRLPNLPETHQQNAAMKAWGVMSENHIQLNNNQKLKLYLWQQQSEKQIPPTMLEPESKAFQTDNNFKISSEWGIFKKKYTSFVRAAYFNDRQNYSDILSNIDADNTYQSFIAEAETKVNLSKQHRLNIGLNNTHTAAIATNLPNNPLRQHIALFTSYAYTGLKEKLRANVSARQEWVDLSSIPFTFSIGSNYSLFRNLHLHGQFAKVFRLPTLNDLYWEPGGNPDLLPEAGYTQEIGFDWQYNYKRYAMGFRPTIFNSNIDNWIVWLPATGHWTPQNIMHVWSRGLETNSFVSTHLNETVITLNLATNYVLSGNQKAKTAHDASIDKQLMYVPMYSGFLKASIEHKAWHLSYRQNYVGYRYISTDNKQYLPPFTIGSIYLSYNKSFEKNKVGFFIRCHNIFNEVYEAVATRPMPLRHYNAGISLNFNKPFTNLKTKQL